MVRLGRKLGDGVFKLSLEGWYLLVENGVFPFEFRHLLIEFSLEGLEDSRFGLELRFELYLLLGKAGR